MTRRPHELRRTEIADAALELIATRGVAALTTTAVAKALGLTSGALFRHFPSREAILEEVAVRVEAILLATLPPPELPPAERIHEFVRRRSSAAAEHAGVLRLMMSDQFTLALPPAAAARLAGVVRSTQAALVETIRAGAEAGAFREDIGAEELAVMVMGVTQMLAFLQAVGPARALEQRTPKMLEALAKLLAPTEPAKRRTR